MRLLFSATLATGSTDLVREWRHRPLLSLPIMVPVSENPVPKISGRGSNKRSLSRPRMLIVWSKHWQPQEKDFPAAYAARNLDPTGILIVFTRFGFTRVKNYHFGPKHKHRLV